MSNPNIVYLHTHDAGRCIEPYGWKGHTPYLQRLAEEGVVFRNAHAVGPTCSPSRAALLTGTYPHANGMFGLSHREAGGFSLADYGDHLIHTLKGAGYVTALAGVQHIDGPDSSTWTRPDQARTAYGSRIGYDHVLNADDIPSRFRATEMAAERAVEFIHDEQNQPFFLSVGFMYPHAPFERVPEGLSAVDPRFVSVPAGLPDTSETREDLSCFITKMQDTDRRMGMVLDAIEASGRADNTIVIATTDHGIAFPGMKCTLRDSGTGVFLIMKGPAIDRGRISDALVSHLDVFPTLCDLAGVEQPDRLAGRSLRPLLDGKTDTLHSEIYSEVTYHAAYQPMRAVRTSRWKYIKRFYNYPYEVYPNQDDSRTKRILSEATRGRTVPREELYDLLLDPSETHNLAGMADWEAIRLDLERRLKSWMETTDDPILHGPISIPHDGMIAAMDVLNKRDGQFTSQEWDERVRDEWRVVWSPELAEEADDR